MKKEERNSHKLKTSFVQKKKKHIKNNSKKDNMKETETIQKISKRKLTNLKNS